MVIHSKFDGSGPILGIIRTNGFMVGSDIFDGPEMCADGNNAHGGVIKIRSRINHRYVIHLVRFFSLVVFFRKNISHMHFLLAACLT